MINSRRVHRTLGMHWRRTAAILAVCSLAALSACSSTSSSGASTGSTDSPSASAPSTTGSPVASGSTSSGSASAPGVKKIAFGVNNQTAGQFVQLAQGFVEWGKKAGITVDVYNNNSDAATAISNAQLMVQAKPDVIVEFPPVADATGRLTTIFKASGIPCIAVNIPVASCAFFNQSQEKFAQLNAENFAKLMKERGWDGTNTTVVIEQGSKLGPTVNIAVTKFYEDISKLVPHMTYVPAEKITPQTTTIAPGGVQVDAGVSASDSYTVFSQALQSIPKDRHIVVYAISDDDILGTYRALTNAGRQNDAMMAGFGCDENAVKGLRSNPAWVGESCGFFTYWGEFLVAMAVAVHNGAKTPATTFSPMVVLTKDNVNDYFAPGETTPKFFPQLPPESQYLADTGVLQKFGNVQGLK